MSLQRSDIEHIASLARLGLEEEEIEGMAKDLSSILEYVDQLQQVDTSGVDYEYQVKDLQNSVRTDKVISCSDEERAIILEDMPDRAGDLLRVPGVFE